jgi:pimeloyl-ACP methyl ester carboxylesterase
MQADRLTEYRRGDLVFDVIDIDSGPIDGTPVVLLHGWPQRASAWDAVSAHLHERGARTFAPDRRGYAPRARPRSRFDYRIPELVADIETLVKTIAAGPVHLVGHDWGAAIAWAFAAQHPESTATLTAVSVPHPQAFFRSLFRSNQLLLSWYIAAFQLPWLPEWFMSRRLFERALRASGMTSEMVKSFRADFVAPGALRGSLGAYRSMVTLRPSAIPGRVTVPTTFVWSDGDPAISRKSAVMTEQFVDADYTFEVMAGVSHWIPELHPAELAEIIAGRSGLRP